MLLDVGFLLGAIALLGTPGPTNTLLATSGAARGFRNSLPLLAGEVCGYVIAITTLIAVAGPVIGSSPAIALVLHAAVAVYLVMLACALWRQGDRQIGEGKGITLPRVFVTTLLNPKAIIFAFVLLPKEASERMDVLALSLAALSLLILFIGAAWIALGAAIRSGAGAEATGAAAHRVGAVALLVFAGLVGLRAAG